MLFTYSHLTITLHLAACTPLYIHIFTLAEMCQVVRHYYYFNLICLAVKAELLSHGVLRRSTSNGLIVNLEACDMNT